MERHHIGRERRAGQAPPVDVCRQCASDGELIGARLLLANAPRDGIVHLERQIAAHQFRPGRPRFDGDQSSLSIEAENPVESAQIEHAAAIDELLAAHGVPPTGDCDGQSATARLQQRGADLVLRTRPAMDSRPGGIVA